MAVFNARNERFLLCCMVVAFVIQTAYYFYAYFLYLNSDDFPEEALVWVENKTELYGYVMLLLSCFYFFSCGSGRKSTFDFPIFYFFIQPLSLFYCSFRYKGFLKGLALILFWVIAFSAPFWTGYLVYTWTYWNYESP